MYRYISLVLALVFLFGLATATSYTLTVNTDKSSYNSGETVYVFGSLKKNGSPVQDAIVGIQVNDASGNVYFIDQRHTNNQGEYSTSFVISGEKTGVFSVYSAYNSVISSIKFTYGPGQGGQTCAQQGGDVCTSTESCPGNWVSASDTDRCCSETCICTESWTCTSWGSCVNGVQTRECNDQNSCGTYLYMPSLSRSCGGSSGGGGSTSYSTSKSINTTTNTSSSTQTASNQSTGQSNENQQGTGGSGGSFPLGNETSPTNQTVNQTKNQTNQSSGAATSGMATGNGGKGGRTGILGGITGAMSSGNTTAVLSILVIIGLVALIYSNNLRKRIERGG